MVNPGPADSGRGPTSATVRPQDPDVVGTPATNRFIGRSPHNPLLDPTPGQITMDAQADGFIPFTSSWIAGARWVRSADYGFFGDLTIRTREGRTIGPYQLVPENVWDDFFAASSAGEFYNNYIKGRYRNLGAES